MEEWAFGYYYAFWCRSGPFIIGVLLGYVMYKTQSKKVKVSWIIVVFAWPIAFATGLAVVYGVNFAAYYAYGDEKTLVESVFYLTFGRHAWGLACAWVIFACTYGYGGKSTNIQSNLILADR